MLAKLPLPLILFLASSGFSNAAPAEPTITPPPLLPRQQKAEFMGWASFSNGTWSSADCLQEQIYYQDDKYAQCCPEGLCYPVTACNSGVLTYSISDWEKYNFTVSGPLQTLVCSTAIPEYPQLSMCNTAYVFESYGDSRPLTNINCGSAAERWSIYRNLPASISELAKSTSQANANSKVSGSQAWIAGAVAGPVIAIAVIAGILFILRRRKHQKIAKNVSGISSDSSSLAPAGYVQPGFNPNGAYPQQFPADPLAQASAYIPPHGEIRQEQKEIFPYQHQVFEMDDTSPGGRYSEVSGEAVEKKPSELGSDEKCYAKQNTPR